MNFQTTMAFMVIRATKTQTWCISGVFLGERIFLLEKCGLKDVLVSVHITTIKVDIRISGTK